MSTGERQRLATWVLTLFTPEYMRDSLIGDLVEQYEVRGAWWYWRQALGAVKARTQSVLLASTQTEVPAAEFIGDLVLSIALCLSGCGQICVYTSLLFRWTPFIRSDIGLLIGSALMGSALICVVAAAHVIRTRTFRQLRTPVA
jgi:hypothetical protein